MSANIQDTIRKLFGDIEVPELDEAFSKQLAERMERSEANEAERMKEEFTKARRL